MRNLKIIKESNENILSNWKELIPLHKVVKNIILSEIGNFAGVELKNKIYRKMGMKIGKNVCISYKVNIDILYPELIEIGDNTTIGFGTTIIAHDFTVRKARIGKVKIGNNVLIGANSTILAGVNIGDNAVVSAMSLVNKDVKENEFVGGVPIKRLPQNR